MYASPERGQRLFSNSTEDAEGTHLSQSIYIECISQDGAEDSCALSFNRHNPFTSAAVRSHVQHVHVPNGKKHSKIFAKPFSLVQYKILLMFGPGLPTAVFEKLIFILYILTNMHFAHRAFSLAPF